MKKLIFALSMLICAPAMAGGNDCITVGAVAAIVYNGFDNGSTFVDMVNAVQAANPKDPEWQKIAAAFVTQVYFEHEAGMPKNQVVKGFFERCMK